MSTKIKKLTLPFLITTLFFTLVACGTGESVSNSEKVTVKIGYLPITHAVPLYLEKELAAQESFKNFNLELVKFGSWPDLMDALNSGRIDGASVLVILAMKAYEQGVDLKAVALGHKEGNVLVVANDVNTVQDLKGTTFAIPHKFSTHNILLYKMLKQGGLDYNDVNVVELPPAEMPSALSQGRISGYVVAEPFGAQSVVMGIGKVLYQDDEIWRDSVDCALVLRTEFIENHRIATEELVDKYIEAGHKAELKNEFARKASAKYMNVDEEVLDLSLKWISYDDLRLDKRPYDKLREALIEMGLSENPPPYEAFVDHSFIDGVR
ncbi:MAG: ABC transporter substrate-binding protein [Bacillaceae bacterium]|nr:ABC transporter substrate-binding protein [Bacillaceae bacterium]